jgi:hypothetical protein
MNRKIFFIILIVFIALIFGLYTLFTKSFQPKGGLKITSNIKASVFINEKLVGNTDYQDRISPGELVVKLIPEQTSDQTVSWQGKVMIVPSFQTYVRREFGPSELTSSLEVISLEKIQGTEAQIAVVTQPEAAVILLDGQEKGITPLVIRDVITGEHEIAVNAPGYISKTIRVQVSSGYKLTVNVQLGITSEGPRPTANPTGTDNNQQSADTTEKKESSIDKVVTIKDTPTGFLRVRSGPSTSSSELTQIKPGEKFTLLEEQSGWYKIAYEEGKEGWISSRYAEVSGE